MDETTFAGRIAKAIEQCRAARLDFAAGVLCACLRLAGAAENCRREQKKLLAMRQHQGADRYREQYRAVSEAQRALDLQLCPPPPRTPPAAPVSLDDAEPAEAPLPAPEPRTEGGPSWR